VDTENPAYKLKHFTHSFPHPQFIYYYNKKFMGKECGKP
jgi:hypothetical protein